MEADEDEGQATPNVGEAVAQHKLSFIASGNAKWYRCFGGWFISYLQN